MLSNTQYFYVHYNDKYRNAYIMIYTYMKLHQTNGLSGWQNIELSL
jgi:hypothetical protein